MIGRNDNCWCGSGKKWKKCHFPEMGPKDSTSNSECGGYNEELAKKYWKQWGIILKTPQQIEGIRKANHLAARILDDVCLLAEPGVTTNYLNEIAHKKIIEAGATPAPLGYGHPPYPKSICTSLNEVICHGIPNDQPLVVGDIMNVDVSVILNGFVGDCSKMVAIGGVTTPERKLVFDTSLLCLQEAAKRAVKPGALVSKIGDVIQEISDKHGTSVVVDFVGHGLGLKMHESPQVPHSKNSLHIPLVPGMTFTIEPMINAGVRDGIIDKRDKWTVRTADGRASAQWEHAFLITETGYELLTPWTVTSCGLM